ncbi:class I SAM-dependent methyltransferase [Azospirillum sp.]|uniref:class I SAM-dependent methyltransferase n=1 Tax=Azospirillum sp. TaxID=34012 RepID=UPI002D5A3665|nr:methyltransferase domain-containing protein [Azospirillum sp.]HYD66879.1 methyltransferase domain-containing protein [Azospirillum sp.]
MAPEYSGPAADPAPYYTRVNRPLLDLLPPGLAAVLDVGCGAGALGRAYRERHPHSAWTGIEVHPEAAAEARRHLAHVVEADAESIDAATVPGGPFDALVYADSLEHFRDPDTALGRHLRLLRPGGVVCASIPNVQHWSAILNLVAGRWEYRDEGLFDRTHLRFFTLDSLVAFFRTAGCAVEEVVPLIPRPGVPAISGWDRHEALLAELERLTASFGLPFDRRRFLAYQYVVRARVLPTGRGRW